MTLAEKRDLKYDAWREGYGEPYVRPKDAWDAGFIADWYTTKEKSPRPERGSTAIGQMPGGKRDLPF